MEDDRTGAVSVDPTGTSAPSAATSSLAQELRAARPAKKAEPAKKGMATPTRRRRASTGSDEERTTPAVFARQSVEELRKAVWPSGHEVWQYFVVVLVFVLFIMAFVLALDTGFGALLLQLLG